VFPLRQEAKGGKHGRSSKVRSLGQGGQMGPKQTKRRKGKNMFEIKEKKTEGMCNESGKRQGGGGRRRGDPKRGGGWGNVVSEEKPISERHES